MRFVVEKLARSSEIFERSSLNCITAGGSLQSGPGLAGDDVLAARDAPKLVLNTFFGKASNFASDKGCDTKD